MKIAVDDFFAHMTLQTISLNDIFTNLKYRDTENYIVIVIA